MPPTRRRRCSRPTTRCGTGCARSWTRRTTAIFQALKEGYRDGIPEGYAHKDVLAAESAFEVMRAADPAAVANLERLPEGTFWSGYLK